MIDRRRSAWRFSVPLVCLLAGLLLAATHGVSGGTEIRRSDAPRLVDLVRRAQASVNRLATEREALTTRIARCTADLSIPRWRPCSGGPPSWPVWRL